MAKHDPDNAVERLTISNLPGVAEDFDAAVDRIARLFNEHDDEADDEGRGPFAMKDGCLECDVKIVAKFRHDPITGATEIVCGVDTKLPSARTKRGHALLKGDTFLVEPDEAPAKLTLAGKNK